MTGSIKVSVSMPCASISTSVGIGGSVDVRGSTGDSIAVSVGFSVRVGVSFCLLLCSIGSISTGVGTGGITLALTNPDSHPNPSSPVVPLPG